MHDCWNAKIIILQSYEEYLIVPLIPKPSIILIVKIIIKSWAQGFKIPRYYFYLDEMRMIVVNYFK